MYGAARGSACGQGCRGGIRHYAKGMGLVQGTRQSWRSRHAIPRGIPAIPAFRSIQQGETASPPPPLSEASVVSHSSHHVCGPMRVPAHVVSRFCVCSVTFFQQPCVRCCENLEPFISCDFPPHRGLLRGGTFRERGEKGTSGCSSMDSTLLCSFCRHE